MIGGRSFPKLSRKAILTILIFSLLSLNVSLMQAQEETTTAEDLPEPVFEFTYLSPVGSSARQYYSDLLVETWPKVGIGITKHEQTDFTSMSQRAWAYEDGNGYNYPIPVFDEGGFDALSVGLSGGITYDPQCTFHTSSVNPTCLNMYDFGNSTTDAMIEGYRTSLDFDVRDFYAKKFQRILREELPTLTLYYTVNLHVVREEMNWDVTDALWKAIGADGLRWAEITGGADSEFSWGHLYGLNEIDPITVTQYLSVRAMGGIFPGLFQRNPDTMRMEPALAADPIEWDGLKATVKLRPDVTFSTGAAMDANDVKESWRWLLTDNTGTQGKSGVLPYIASNDSIVVVDDHTLEFTFTQAYLEPELMLNSAAIMPDEVLGPVDNPLIAEYDFTVDPINLVIGTGPFKYSMVDPVAKEIRLTAVPNWWGGDIAAETVYFPHFATKDAALVAIKAGAVDYIDNNYVVEIAEVAGAAGVEGIEGVMSGGVQMVSLNLNHPVFGTGVDTPMGKSDPSRASEAARYVRHAMNHMVPRDQIVTDILKGLGVAAVSNWPQLSPHYDSSQTVAEYSIEKATELLKKAGYDNSLFTTTSSLTLAPAIYMYIGIGIAIVANIVTRYSIVRKTIASIDR
ncbi:MAG: ABC transporter substrate-binding protein [Candidatus Kariarchaeaceae archaeon]|jgi:ABC-type transport system substrate-binding protein